MTPPATRSIRGKTSFHAGEAAEDAVARVYQARGCKLVAKRWRGSGGEIDLIFRDGATCLFVEVKKSTSFDAAASRISARQMQRIFAAAEEFLGGEPNGLLTETRFDAALVDACGRVQVRENALMDG